MEGNQSSHKFSDTVLSRVHGRARARGDLTVDVRRRGACYAVNMVIWGHQEQRCIGEDENHRSPRRKRLDQPQLSVLPEMPQLLGSVRIMGGAGLFPQT